MPGFRYTSSRMHLENFAREAAESLREVEGARVLDAGAGTRPYDRFFERHAVYECADIAQPVNSAPLTYICDLATIPVADERYDLVFLSQVLEHLPEPARVLTEMARVLRPGGELWLSTPLFYEEHEAPYDFFRYTQFSLRRLTEGAGFEVTRIAWLEGYLGTLGYQVRMAADQLPRDPSAYGGSLAWSLAVRAARPALRRLGWRLDAFDSAARWTSSGMPKNYILTARKPA